MITFKNSLAFRVFNFALKVEKISKDISKAKKIEEPEELKKLQANIEEHLNNLFLKANQVESILRGEKHNESK